MTSQIVKLVRDPTVFKAHLFLGAVLFSRYMTDVTNLRIKQYAMPVGYIISSLMVCYYELQARRSDGIAVSGAPTVLSQ